ncbi:MAG: hypothetical protein DCF19_22530 [Pseudanabaena frigida]|uniref:DUF3592 domain-containing protein n=1 Tax=Pseudanabaena frigida TaxID=945775 RepID=A0A2W4XNC6_9CYAN|nr:MAG: hypothetical protein DCF19_22530 [Pseudanabaena frigida]
MPKHYSILNVFFVLFGIWILYTVTPSLTKSTNNLFQGYQNKSWDSVNGRIINSFISSSKSKSIYYFTPNINYRYTVAKTSYTNNTISFNTTETANKNEAEAKIAKYPIGAEIKVFYNPNSPSISCIEPNFFLWENLFVFSYSAFIVAFGIILIFFQFFRKE